MSRNNIDNQLREKLRGMETTPPEGAWSRLESSLSEARREQMAARAAEAAQTGGVSIRRPRRRRIGWTYIAASVAVVAILLFVSSMLKEAGTESMIAGNGPQSEASPAAVETDRHASPVEEGAKHDGEGQPERWNERDGIRGDMTPAEGKSGGSYRAAGDAVKTTPGSDVKYAAGREENPAGREANATAGPETPGEDMLIADAGDASDNARTRNREDVRSADPTDQPQGDAVGGANSEAGGQNYLTEETMRRLLAEREDTRRRNSKGRGAPSVALYASNAMSGSGDGDGTFRYGRPSQSIAGESKPLNEELSFDHNYPITTGVMVDIPLSDRWSVQTGVTYTYLKSSASESIMGVMDAKGEQKLHYLGIPVMAKYKIVDKDRIDVYASAGGSVEKCVSGVRKASLISDGQTVYSEKDNTRGRGPQLSVGANAGVEFKIVNGLGLYVEPGIGYYFDGGRQPENYRTENRLNFTAKAGLVIKLGEK